MRLIAMKRSRTMSTRPGGPLILPDRKSSKSRLSRICLPRRRCLGPTIEGVFSVFKRGMVGVYQHCGEAHLHRYLAEFDFRYNRRAALKVSDAERSEDLLRMARDKRLTYRRIGEAGHA